ncbi:hypothetical protein [Sinomonas halotolerans]|uniref:Helix-turn-helix domain-containing protein n=1 Tax=Sinomonas halotolerans TaxID=1644133 RepID=A0ABU9WYV7_9MICC
MNNSEEGEAEVGPGAAAARAVDLATEAQALIGEGRLLEALPRAKDLEKAVADVLSSAIRSLRGLPQGDRPSWDAIGKAMGVTGSSVYSQYSESSGQIRAAQIEYMRSRRRPVEPEPEPWGMSLAEASAVAEVPMPTLARWAGGSKANRDAGVKPRAGIEVRDLMVPKKSAAPGPDGRRPLRVMTRFMLHGDMVKRPGLIPERLRQGDEPAVGPEGA